MDKDLGIDMTNDATRTFGVTQEHKTWSLGGFIKSGSSDSYVLLGGGGHKLVSDFSMAHNHPYLPLSGGTMSNTNKVTNLNADLLDGYHASSFSLTSHTHSYIVTQGDNRSVATTPNDYKNKITFAGLKTNTTIGRP